MPGLVGNVMYAAFGPISVLTFGNGRLLTSQYDLDYNFSYNFDVATGGLNLGVLVDDVGNITTLTSTLNGTGTTRNYTYDGLDRLKLATTAGTPSRVPVCRTPPQPGLKMNLTLFCLAAIQRMRRSLQTSSRNS